MADIKGLNKKKIIVSLIFVFISVCLITLIGFYIYDLKHPYTEEKVNKTKEAVIRFLQSKYPDASFELKK